MQFISPILWDDAIDKLGARTPIGSALTSEEWSRIPLGLRERAFFSSQIESVRFMQRARDFMTDFQSRAIETLPDGRTALKAGGRQQFVKELSEFAISEGMGPLDAHDAGTLKDITSEGRLNLIFDVMTQSANDYAFWKQGMDPDVLDAYPAQRFIRERDVKQPRPVHQTNEGVVMRKDDLRFWLAMNDASFGGFGVPWGPWGFNSGMGVEDVDREEAEQIGVIQKNETVKPVEKDFNEHLEASTKGLDADMVAKLKESFGDQVVFENDTVKWAGSQAKPGPNVEKPKPAPTALPEGGTPSPEATTLTDVLSKVGLDEERPATARDMKALRTELQESKPVDELKMVKYIKGAQPAGALTDENISGVVQEFLSFFPEKLLRTLPKLQLEVVRNGDFLGKYSGAGVVKLNQNLLRENPERARRTLFHELMHWIHLDGPQWYRDAIRKHFEERTAGERIKKLPGYRARGKLDDWYEAYAGRIYNYEMTPAGLEVPTRYIEWLTYDADKMAELWNNRSFRETMKIVLQAMF